MKYQGRIKRYNINATVSGSAQSDDTGSEKDTVIPDFQEQMQRNLNGINFSKRMESNEASKSKMKQILDSSSDLN